MEATVAKEYVTEGGREVKEMSDGRILVRAKDRPNIGTMFGGFVNIEGEVTPEKLAEAKKLLVDEVCQEIRKITSETDEFFIIKNPCPPLSEWTSIALKYILCPPASSRDTNE